MAVSVKEIIALIIGLSVALFLEATLMPLSLQAIATANTTGLSTEVISMFQTVLPVIAIIGTVLAFIAAGIAMYRT